MSHVRLVMKTPIELMVIVKYVIHMASLYGYRSKLELTHRELEAALKPISGDEVQEEEVHDFRRRLHRVTDLIIKWYFNVECVVIVVYCFIPPTIVIVQYAVTGVVPPLSNLIESDYVLFDYKSKFEIWLLVAFVTGLAGVYILIAGIISDLFSWCQLIRIAGLFRIVAAKFRNLDKFQKESEFRKELIKVVNLQEIAYRSARQFDEFLGKLQLYLYGACICTLCMTMIVMATASEDCELLYKMFLILWFMVFQIFAYSMLGTEIMSASFSAAEAIYEIRWYERSVENRKLILQVLMRSQEVVTMSAEKFVCVNRETFGAVLRSTFSYYTVLRRLYDA
ncbi:hypothetical protein quinque_013126 [Culex quinquefasciatus]